MRRVLTAALLVALAFISPPAMAQTTNGVIAGIISDAQGGVLPGVTVTARNVDTGATRNITTEADGRFRLAGLVPGRYELKAELQGFGTVTVPDVTVAVSSETTRNVTMQVQGLQESVTVTGEAPVIEVTKTDVSGIVTQDQMQMLPLATRQPMDLALLLPGTNQDAVRARKANSNIGAGAFTNGSALLVDGALAGTVMVMSGEPPFMRRVTAVGPTMALVAGGVLVVGGAMIALGSAVGRRPLIRTLAADMSSALMRPSAFRSAKTP